MEVALAVRYPGGAGHQHLDEAGIVAVTVDFPRRQFRVGGGDGQRGAEPGVGGQPVGGKNIVFRCDHRRRIVRLGGQADVLAPGIEDSVGNAVLIEEVRCQGVRPALNTRAVRQHRIRAHDTVRVPVAGMAGAAITALIARAPWLRQEVQDAPGIDSRMDVSINKHTRLQGLYPRVTTWDRLLEGK